MRLVGYVRVSTEEQGRSRLGLDAQRASITAYAGAGEHSLVWAEDVGLSAKSMKRPALADALQSLKRGQADAIVVAKLDRLSRSVQDFAGILDTARKQDWAVIALDLGVDTTTPAGELVANVMAAVAQWERRTISVRTSEALVAAQARGVQLGRPVAVGDAVVARIHADRAAGLSFSRIARALNDEGVPTAHGGSAWHTTTIQRIYKRTAA
jgi:DNA invertase Pin-like site-specific DNA recombinase